MNWGKGMSQTGHYESIIDDDEKQHRSEVRGAGGGMVNGLGGHCVYICFVDMLGLCVRARAVEIVQIYE